MTTQPITPATDSRPYRPGELVHIDGKPQVWRVVDYHGPLVRLVPVPRSGRIVHLERLTPAEAP